MLCPALVPEPGPFRAPPTLVNWLVKRGARVTAGERIAEILVDDVLLEVPAPANGRLVRKFVRVDEAVVAGQKLAEVEVAESPGE